MNDINVDDLKLCFFSPKIGVGNHLVVLQDDLNVEETLNKDNLVKALAVEVFNWKIPIVSSSELSRELSRELLICDEDSFAIKRKALNGDIADLSMLEDGKCYISLHKSNSPEDGVTNNNSLRVLTPSARNMLQHNTEEMHTRHVPLSTILRTNTTQNNDNEDDKVTFSMSHLKRKLPNIIAPDTTNESMTEHMEVIDIFKHETDSTSENINKMKRINPLEVCEGCAAYAYSFTLCESRILPKTPTKLCRYCYFHLHYDVEGNLLQQHLIEGETLCQQNWVSRNSQRIQT